MTVIATFISSLELGNGTLIADLQPSQRNEIPVMYSQRLFGRRITTSVKDVVM